MAILISAKVDFRTKKITRDKEGYYIMIKGSIHQEDIANLIVYGTKQMNCKIREAEHNGMEKRNRQIHNFTWSFQHLSLSPNN